MRNTPINSIVQAPYACREVRYLHITQLLLSAFSLELIYFLHLLGFFPLPFLILTFQRSVVMVKG